MRWKEIHLTAATVNFRKHYNLWHTYVISSCFYLNWCAARKLCFVACAVQRFEANLRRSKHLNLKSVLCLRHAAPRWLLLALKRCIAKPRRDHERRYDASGAATLASSTTLHVLRAQKRRQPSLALFEADFHFQTFFGHTSAAQIACFAACATCSNAFFLCLGSRNEL